MTEPLPTFHLTLEADLFPYFVPLLQQGVFLQAKAGENIKSFLCETLGILPEYAEKRIQTVFADGKVVDDWERTVLAGSVQGAGALGLFAWELAQSGSLA